MSEILSPEQARQEVMAAEAAVADAEQQIADGGNVTPSAYSKIKDALTFARLRAEGAEKRAKATAEAAVAAERRSQLDALAADVADLTDCTPVYAAYSALVVAHTEFGAVLADRSARIDDAGRRAADLDVPEQVAGLARFRADRGVELAAKDAHGRHPSQGPHEFLTPSQQGEAVTARELWAADSIAANEREIAEHQAEQEAREQRARAEYEALQRRLAEERKPRYKTQEVTR